MPRAPERTLARYTAPLGAALAAGVTLLLPANPLLWDALNRAFPDPAPSRVVLVAIDEATLRTYGRLSTWPPELYGQALRTLRRAGASATGLDVVLDPLEATRVLRSLRPAGASGEAPGPVVLAAAPGQPLPPPLPGQARWGVSALNVSADGVVRAYQTAYPQGQTLAPSFARELVRAAGHPAPLSAHPSPLRRVQAPAQVAFQDLVNGQTDPGTFRGRVTVLGVTAAGAAPAELRDITRQAVSGLALQGQAVDTLLRPLPVTPAPWLLALLGAATAAATILLRGLWGFGLAFGLLAVAAGLWFANVLLPGVTLSLCAVLGTALVAAERAWRLRVLGTRDPLTGYGNRVAFTRALEQRWQQRGARPLGLLLVDVSGFAHVNAAHGRPAGDDLLRELAGRVGRVRRRGDMLFRWGADEFAVLMDHTTPAEVDEVSTRLEAALADLPHGDLSVRASVGAACTGPDVDTPTALVEAASRNRYRRRYQQG